MVAKLRPTQRRKGRPSPNEKMEALYNQQGVQEEKKEKGSNGGATAPLEEEKENTVSESQEYQKSTV